LDNALKFTDEGGVTLRVGGKTSDLISFEIEDTGMGVSEEELVKIFDPFYQSGDKKYRAEGTGLGLSVTRNLIDLMGGKLRVRSQMGSGSIFSFELRLPEAVKGKETQTEKQNVIGAQENSPSIEILENLRSYSAMGDIEEIRNLLAELKQAASDGDSEQLHRTIACIRPRHSFLADELDRLADDFAFDAIFDIIDSFMSDWIS
jgi:hypothetical protein